jgi:Na+/H+ antiporter NhaD/arsenite permease-like protein
MFILMIVVFILGYVAIALEHPLKVDKAATALLIGVLTWVVLILGADQILVHSASFKDYLQAHGGENHGWKTYIDFITHQEVVHHLGEIAQIIFFLLGAMTIVELIDSHEGFRLITDRVKTTNKVKLLWILTFLTFFMSSVLDNLTTSIVMVALLRKLIADKKDRWFFASMVILAANAGGAWSPIGDVTTIMLWIGGQVTTFKIMSDTFLPSIANSLVPLIVLSFVLKGNVTRPEIKIDEENVKEPTTSFERNIVFFLGVGSLLFVPVFKTVTHLPPYMGILFGLANLWIVTEILHRNKNHEEKSHYSVVGVLRRVDVPSVLFFLGILSAVAALQTAGHLRMLAESLDNATSGNIYLIDTAIGILSAVVDNVPLVAGAMGMYSLADYATDHQFWSLLAYTAGTGGSILIIGSAAGVAVMGMEKIDFIWYMKKISWIALIGYFAGIAVYYLQHHIVLG